MPHQDVPRNLLLAIDGSEHANAAIQLVNQLPLTDSCQIDIVSVLIPRNAQYHVFLEDVLNRAKVALEKHATKQVQTHLLTGYPAEQIVSYIEEHKPDLTVLGALGLRSTFGILLGGVAQQVVEYAGCPVLIVRSPFRHIHNVLIATDGSEHSRYVLEYIKFCPLPADANIHVLHVLPPEINAEMLGQFWRMDMEFSPILLSEPMQQQIEQQKSKEEMLGKTIIQDTLAQLRDLVIPTQSVLRRGDAATEIIEYAKSEKIDLIIAGSRGLSEFRSWLLGSVSRKLVHYADCSVLIVKKPQTR
jgi:nucleotide-binding universal stress UspA family protein